MVNTREAIERLLMDRESFVSPITIDDYNLFRSFGCGYKNTLTYNAQAVNGWNPKGESANRLGLKYHNGIDLLTIGHFKRNESKHFHLIPCESSTEKIAELAQILYELSDWPVYVKKVDKGQRDALLNIGFVEVDGSNGWCEAAFQEADTYPEQIIDLEHIIDMLANDGRPDFKDKFLRAQKRYSGRLRVEDYCPDLHGEHAMEIVQGFFVIQKEKNNHLSVPEDYFNILHLKPRGVDYFSSIFYIDGTPAGFYFAERAADVIHTYANLALHTQFKYLSEFILVHLFQEAFKKGVKKANLGGSETRGLRDFKQKFMPIEERQMHWLLFGL